MSTLPDDFWMHDEATQTLTGRRTGLSFRLAQQLEVRLSEATPVTGGLLFHVLQGVPARAGATGERRGPAPKRPGGGKATRAGGQTGW